MIGLADCQEICILWLSDAIERASDLVRMDAALRRIE